MVVGVRDAVKPENTSRQLEMHGKPKEMVRIATSAKARLSKVTRKEITKGLH